MQKAFSSSNLLLGIIEEIDVFKIKYPSNFSYYSNDRLENKELAESIKEHGLIQPIMVRTFGDYFEIVSGNRRYSACKSIGWRKIICHIVELDDKSAFEVSLTENIQRKTLDPIEEAKAFKLYVQDFGFGGVSDLAKRIGKSPSYICKRLNILGLPSEIIEGIQNDVIKPSIAEELLPLHNLEERKRISKIILKERISARETRDLVKNFNKPSFAYNKNDNPDIKDIDVLYRDNIVDIDALAQRSFDKSITTLKMALSRIAKIIDNVEENWIVYEILMQHKNMLNSQIDLLIKQKKKI